MGAAALISLIMPVESRAARSQCRPLRRGAEAAAREQHDAGARVAMACRKQCVSKAFCRANARSTAVGSAPRSRERQTGCRVRMRTPCRQRTAPVRSSSAAESGGARVRRAQESLRHREHPGERSE